MTKSTHPNYEAIATRAYEVPDSLACALVRTAEWRIRCSDEFPDDRQNLVAAGSLLQLADDCLSLSTSNVFLEMYQECFDSVDDVSELVNLESIILRGIGFATQYDRIEYLLVRLIDEFRSQLWPAGRQSAEVVYH